MYNFLIVPKRGIFKDMDGVNRAGEDYQQPGVRGRPVPGRHERRPASPGAGRNIPDVDRTVRAGDPDVVVRRLIHEPRNPAFHKLPRRGRLLDPRWRGNAIVQQTVPMRPRSMPPDAPVRPLPPGLRCAKRTGLLRGRYPLAIFLAAAGAAAGAVLGYASVPPKYQSTGTVLIDPMVIGENSAMPGTLINAASSPSSNRAGSPAPPSSTPP